MTLLSVIVPVREMAGRLQNLRRWLAVVGDKSLEVIIVHDFFDEATDVELRQIGKEFQHLRIKIFTEKLNSPGLARNIGIERASGEFISFWDSDDLPKVDAVMSDLSTTEKNIDVLIGQFESVESARPGVGRFKSDDSQLIDLALNPGLWRMAFRAEKLLGIRFSKYKMGEDQDFLASVITTTDRLKFSNRIWYTYFTNNSGQLTLNKSAIKELKDLIPRATLHQKHASPVILPVIMVMQIRKVITLFRTNSVIGSLTFFKYLADSLRIGGIKVLPTFIWSLGYACIHSGVNKI